MIGFYPCFSVNVADHTFIPATDLSLRSLLYYALLIRNWFIFRRHMSFVSQLIYSDQRSLHFCEVTPPPLSGGPRSAGDHVGVRASRNFGIVFSQGEPLYGSEIFRQAASNYTVFISRIPRIARSRPCRDKGRSQFITHPDAIKD